MEYYVRLGNVIKLTGTKSIIISTNGIAWEELEAFFSEIYNAGLEIDTKVLFRLFRVPTDGQDTYNKDVVLTEISLHYQADTLGSRKQDEK